MSSTVDVQLPPFDRVEVGEGNSTSVLHRIWFNDTQENLRLYLTFDSITYEFSGEHLDGNLNVTYSTVCDILGCLGPTPVQLPTGGAKRCQTIEVTVQGNRKLNGSNIKFQLFDISQLLFQGDVIRSIGVTVIGKWNYISPIWTLIATYI